MEKLSKYDICDFQYCTGCKICSLVCPKSCISFIEQSNGVKYPIIDNTLCVNCDLCRKSCPSLQKIKKNQTKQVFAGWSTNEEIRKSAASGGIATSLYKFFLDQGWYVCGCKFNEKLELVFDITNDYYVAKKFQNSKYVESDLGDLPLKIDNLLQKNEKVFFVGVPCQVAAVKKFINKNKNSDNLFTADLICHGFAPHKYFKQHIENIENKYDKCISSVYFRDRTEKKDYIFTLYDDKENKFYKKAVNDNDLYHLGFHRAYIYRENCYHCIYSENNRVGDITLGDYSGLGTCNPPFTKDVDFNVSCILINSDKGLNIIKQMNAERLVYLEKRPLKEPFIAQGQLNAPCKKSDIHNKFITSYKISKDFDYSAKKSYGQEATNLYLKQKLKYYQIRSFLIAIVKKILPKNMIDKIKTKI